MSVKGKLERKETEMTTLAFAKQYLREYIENSGFTVSDENTLDDAARELRDADSFADIDLDELIDRYEI